MKKTLTETELQDVLQALPEWKLKDGKLVREWTFSNFLDSMAFVNRVAVIAEDAGHHPDIDIRYNKVLLSLISHDAGGITQRDAAMAIRINRDLDGYSSPNVDSK